MTMTKIQPNHHDYENLTSVFAKVPQVFASDEYSLDSLIPPPGPCSEFALGATLAADGRPHD